MQTLYGGDIWASYEPGPQQDAVEGWNGNHPSLKRLAASAGDHLVVDVGVWKGQSTISMARAMKENGIDGCVIAVDTFLGSPEHWDSSRKLFARQHGMPDLYWTFLSNVVHAGVRDYVIPMPQTSVTAAMTLRRLKIRPALVHIDAAHEYEEVLRDAQEYWDILQPGGNLIGDDYHRTWPGVIRAAGEFSARTQCPLSIEPPKWILQKNR